MARSGPGSKQRRTVCSLPTFAPFLPGGTTQSSALENGPGTSNLGERLVGAEVEEGTSESHKRERVTDGEEDDGGAFSRRRGLKRRRIMLISDDEEVEGSSGEEKGGVSSTRREGEVVGEMNVEEDGEEKVDVRSRGAEEVDARATTTGKRIRRKKRSREHQQHRRSKQQRGAKVDQGEEEGNGGDVDDGGEIDSSMMSPSANGTGANAGGGCNGSSSSGKERKRKSKKRRSRVGGEVVGSAKRIAGKKSTTTAAAGATRGSSSSSGSGSITEETLVAKHWKPKARVVKVKICGFQRMCIKVEYRPGVFKRFFPHKVGMKAAKEMAKECVKKARELVKAGAIGQRCAICQGALKNAKTIAKLEECGHQYHRKCLMQWVEKQNTCPNCRVRIQKLDGKVVENRDLRVDLGGAFPAPQYENLLCQICNLGDRPDSFLICDMCDASGCHMECLGLLSVPEGEWFCPWCVENELQLVQSQRDPRISTFLHLEGVDLLKDLRMHGRELVRQACEQQEPASSASPPVSCERVCWNVQPGEESLSHWMEIHEIEYAGWQWQGTGGNPLFQVWFSDDDFFDAALRDLEQAMLPHRGFPVMALTAEFTDDDGSSDEGSDDDDDDVDDDEDDDDSLDDDDDGLFTFYPNFDEDEEEEGEEDDSDGDCPVFLDDLVLRDPDSHTNGTSEEDSQDKTSGEDEEDDVDYEPPGSQQVDGEDDDSMSKDEEGCDSFEEWESSDSDETESEEDFDSSGSEESPSSDDGVDCLDMPGHWSSDDSRDGDHDGEDDEDVDYEPPLDPDVVGGSAAAAAGAGAGAVPRPVRGTADSANIAAAVQRIHRFHSHHADLIREIQRATSPDLRGRTILRGRNVFDEGLSDGIGLRGRNLRQGGLLSDAPSMWGFGAPGLFEFLWRSRRRLVRSSNWEEERRRESSTEQAHVRTGFSTKHLERNRFFHECRSTARFRGWSITTSGMMRLPVGVHAESVLKQNANARIVGRGLVFFGESPAPFGLR
ncbi:hypothetical protein CBR_g49719 [Chara braunii]|uniref:RING-type domain-containing protein n=1 Tax=Chara braunii TaxID=69332 RepID=A0A388M5N7_CHABU|nr:hypothetical protein CBR_g49719 [Chara braunii]|eukprot:GBG89871.1 hypothetical protein CBR_g49719 [Chara braunii]